MYSIIETFATAVLLLLLMMFVLHLIRGDAADWLTSKFQIDAGERTTLDSNNSSPSPSPLGQIS